MSELQWRVPTIKELQTLVDYSERNPAMSKDCPFRNTDFYWSSTTYASGPGSAWGVDFNGGHVYSDSKYGNGYVRCVRGGQLYDYGHLIINGISKGQEEFTVINKEEVRDNRTGLIWQKNLPEKKMTWQKAMDYAESLNQGGNQ